jgi:DNA-binding MarR family transcriptional regulator
MAYDAAMSSSAPRTADPSIPGEPSVASQTWRHLIEVCFGVVREHFVRTVADFDLAPTQAHALCHLEPGRAVPMGDLAELLKCDPSNVTGVVDRLEARGLVERRAAASDRRVRTLVLTAEGVDLRDRLTARLYRPPAALTTLAPDDQQQLGALLRHVLERYGGPPPKLP